MNNLKIALVSDIHYGKLIEHRPGEEAIELLSRFVSHVNTEGYDAVFDLGDRVNNESHDADLKYLCSVKSVLSELGCPYFNVMGNHDMHYLSKEENKQILGLDSTYYSVILGDYKLIILDTTDPIYEECGGTVSKTQLEWFEDKLNEDNLPKIIVSHHPLITQNQNGNPFFVRILGQYKVSNNTEVQSLISKKANVLACLNGHVHWLYSAVQEGIPYISIPSLVESYPLFSDAPGRYATATFSEQGIDVSFETLNPRRTLGRFVF